MSGSTIDVPSWRARVGEVLPSVRADLEDLVRIPSVSADSADQAQVERSAQASAQLLRGEGLDVEIVREGGRPAVIAHRSGPPGAATVTLYAHHDVQPVGDLAQWNSEPFEPTERDGRLFGRGAADDKAGICVHVAALRAHGADLPVSVNVFIEGEEEVGSASLPQILDKHGDKLAADAIVLADSGNWETGVPALTTSLRGLIRATVTVRTLDHGVHSGMFGGPVPDAITALTRLLATLHDEQGNVAIEGLQSGDAAPLPYDEARLREESGLLDGVQLIGTGSILDRLWTKPALTVIGMDVPSVATASNTLSPSARALVSLRLAPNQDPEVAFDLLRRAVIDRAPWGAAVEVELMDAGPGFAAHAEGPIYDAARDSFADAWGVAPVDMGVGGSIPFIDAFARRFPQAAILITGVEDPDSRAHGANESLHLESFEHAALAETLLLARLGQGAPAH